MIPAIINEQQRNERNKPETDESYEISKKKNVEFDETAA